VQTGLDNVTTIGTALEDGDLPAGRFDAAIGRYMLMLLADPTGALVKVRRALRGGAHAAMAVFAARERNPFLSVPTDVVRQYAGLAAEEPDAPARRRSATLREPPRPVRRGHPMAPPAVSARLRS
jgi:hypothetical protein